MDVSFNVVLKFLFVILYINLIYGARIEKRTTPTLIIGPIDESVCQPEPTEGSSQYMIGYGTLINEDYKNKFYKEASENFPIRVKGFGRHFNLQKPTIGFGATTIGAVLDPGASFNAVAFKLPEPIEGEIITTALIDIDRRQSSFCRQRVPLESIDFLLKKDEEINAGDYWIYLTKQSFTNLPNPSYPIIQSYVDTFMTGCIEVGKKFELSNFADECVLSTFGWETSWVNDRVSPRARNKKNDEIDRILSINAPLGFSQIRIE